MITPALPLRAPARLALASALLASAALAGPPPAAGTWTPTLDENFNGSGLNTALWSAGMRWAPVINNEIQGYVPANVSVANGVCTILAEKRTVKNTDWVGYEVTTQNYASGAIQTYNKWTQTYGYFEARVKMPAAKGTWPAFWLLPDRGASVTPLDSRVQLTPAGQAPGNEIDVFEYMGSWKNPATGVSRSHSGYFWNYSGGNRNSYTRINELLNPDTTFHTYGLYWGPGVLRFYIDGRLVHGNYDTGNVGSCPHYLILNVAMHTNDWTGNTLSLANDIDPSLPGVMEIDYVRAWSGTAGAGNASGDIGSVGLAGSHSFNADTTTLEGAGSGLSGTADAFHYVGQELTGDGTVTVRLSSLTNPHASARAGIMVRERVDEPGSKAVFIGKTPDGQAHFHRRSTAGGSTSVTSTAASSSPWLRVIRAGDTFTTHVSTDGANWTQVGSQNIAMPATVFVGPAVSSYTSGARATAVFADFKVTPALVGRDIAPHWATPGVVGSTSKSGGVHTVSGSGNGFANTTEDRGHFASQTIAGDGMITARVTGLSGGDQYWARAGVMMRDTLHTKGRSFFVAVTPTNTRTFQRRTGYDSSGTQTNHSLGGHSWVRLRRVGATITGHVSADGVAWTEVGTATVANLPEVLEVGLAVTSNTSSALSTATFDNVSFNDWNAGASGGSVNLAPQGVVSGYSSQQSANPASYLIDDNLAQRWAANGTGYPHWVEVDLGGNRQIHGTEVHPYLNRDYRFRIEARSSGGSYATVVDRTANTAAGPMVDSFAPVTARYVRITVTGAHSYSGNWATLNELRILGSAGAPLSVSAVTASAQQTGNEASKSIDGDLATRWAAQGVPHWIRWDLGSTQTVQAARFSFYNLRQYAFGLEASTNGSTWTPVLSNQTSAGVSEAMETFTFPAPVSARYLRYNGAGNNLNDWNSIREAELIGD